MPEHLHPNEGVFAAAIVPRTSQAPLCECCGGEVYDVWACAGCSVSGHRQCLGVSFVAGYPFCVHCIDEAQGAYDRHTEEQRARWMQANSRRIASWRRAIAATTSITSAVGVAAGATAGSVIAGAASLVAGMATGAAAAVAEARSPRLTLQQPEVASESGEHQAQFTSVEDLRAEGDVAASEIGPEESPSAGGAPVAHAVVNGNDPVSLTQSSGVVRTGERVSLTPEVGVTRTLAASDHDQALQDMGGSGVETPQAPPPTFGEPTLLVCVACLPQNRGKRIPHLHAGTCTATFRMRDAERAGHCLACHEGWHSKHIRVGSCKFATSSRTKEQDQTPSGPVPDERIKGRASESQSASASSTPRVGPGSTSVVNAGGQQGLSISRIGPGSSPVENAGGQQVNEPLTPRSQGSFFGSGSCIFENCFDVGC